MEVCVPTLEAYPARGSGVVFAPKGPRRFFCAGLTVGGSRPADAVIDEPGLFG